MKIKPIAVGALAANFIISFMGSSLNPAIPSIADEFGMYTEQVSRIITAYMLTCTVLPVPLCRISARWKSEWMLAAGLAVFTASSAAGCMVMSFRGLTVCRLFQGAGTSLIYGTALTVLTVSGQSEQNGRILGMATAATYLGLSLGPGAGGLLTEYVGWRWILISAAAISAAALFCVLLQLKKIRDKPYSVSRRDVPLSLKTLPGMLCRTEYLTSLIQCGAVFVVNYLLSVYLQTGSGISAGKTGMLLIVLPAVQTAASVWTGRLTDRTKSVKWLMAAGLAGTGAGCGMFALLQEEVSLWYVAGGLSILGFSGAFFAVPNTAEILKGTEGEERTLAAAMLSTVRSLGHLISMTAASAAAFLAGNGQGLEPLHWTSFLWIILCILGFLMVLRKKM